MPANFKIPMRRTAAYTGMTLMMPVGVTESGHSPDYKLDFECQFTGTSSGLVLLISGFAAGKNPAGFFADGIQACAQFLPDR